MNVAGGSGTVGFSNPGYWGISVKVQNYQGSFYVKGSYSGNFTRPFPRPQTTSWEVWRFPQWERVAIGLNTTLL